MPPPQVMQGNPHLNPTLQSIDILLLFCQGSWSLLLSGFICQEKRKVKDGKDKLKKERFLKYILAQNSEKKNITGVYYLSCVMWPPDWAPPQPHPLIPLPVPLPLTPSILLLGRCQNTVSMEK